MARSGAATRRPCRRPGTPRLPDQVSVTLIELTEVAPPDAATATAWRLVDWYRCRWLIELLFRLLKKQGLELEESQIAAAERLIKLTAVATRARADHPPTDPGARRPVRARRRAGLRSTRTRRPRAT